MTDNDKARELCKKKIKRKRMKFIFLAAAQK